MLASAGTAATSVGTGLRVRGRRRSGPADALVRRVVAMATRAVGALAVVVLVSGAYELRLARGAAVAGQRALQTASASLRAGDTAEAGRASRLADREFASARGDLRVLRWVLGPVARVAAVDEQLDAIDTLAVAGGLASRAAAQVTASVAPRPRSARSVEPIAELRRVRRALARGLATLDVAAVRLDTLRTASLAGPVAGSADVARRRLRGARRQGGDSLQALGALIAFAGGDGPKRYLVLSQNPAEVRPTGGFIGTYGVLEARDGHIRLARYRSIESWYFRHRRAVVAPDDAPPALRLGRRPIAQTIANANAAGDWPVAARLAARLWRAGGEAPIDGVISITPDLIARALRVLGPVRVRGYPGAATSQNIVELLDRQTHTGARARAVDRPPFTSLRAARERKRYVALLARALMRRATTSPVARLKLARAIGRGFAAREAMAWSVDPAIQRVLRARGWDGAIPRVRGDFFYDGEFQYAVKTGRGLHRRFRHDVTLRADGSAHVTTTIVVANTRGDGMDSHDYMTLYGPHGAYLNAASDPPTAIEPALAGHPAAGWLRTTPSWGTTRIRVDWDVPRMLVRHPDGRLVYRLLWMHVPAHRGDVLRLRVTPPPGWRWAHAAPPSTRRLGRDVRGAWSLVR